MAKVVTQKQMDEIVRLKDEESLSFQDIGKQLNLDGETVSKFYKLEVAKKKKIAEEIEKADLAASGKKEKPYKLLATNKTVSFDPSALAVIEQLKKKGIFNDMDEAVNKALEMMAAQTNNPKYVDFLTKGGEIKMSEEEPNPAKQLKEMQVTDMVEAQINKKKAEAEALLKKVESGNATPNSFMPILQEQLAMKQMQKLLKDINSDSNEVSNSNPVKEMKEMMMMQVYANMMGGNNHKGNGEALQLKQKIEELQRDIKDSKMLGEVKKIAEGSQGKSMGAEDYIKLFADKNAAVEKQKLEIEKARQETQTEREKRIEEQTKQHQENTHRQIQALETRLSEAKKSGSGVDEISKLKTNLTTLQEIAKDFGSKEKEKTTGEIAADLVLGVAEKLKDPINNATKGFADKMATERMKAGGQPVYTNQPGAPMPLNPGPEGSVVQPETTEPTLQDAFEPPPETPAPQDAPESSPEVNPPEIPPATPDKDIVNTFASQNTSKKSIGSPSTG